MKLQLPIGNRLHIPTPHETLKIGLSSLGNAANYNRVFWEQTSDLFFPKKTPSQFTRDLKMMEPLHEAEIGFDAIERGEKKKDWELFFVGGALAVRAVVKSYRREQVNEVSPAITKTIVKGIIEHEIDPFEQPLLSDDIVERSQPPMRKYGKPILDLFPSLKNKL